MKAEDVEKYGISAQGKAEYIKYLNGEHLSYKEHCLAQCYHCMGMYKDGKFNCGCKECPMYSLMPYSKEEPKV